MAEEKQNQTIEQITQTYEEKIAQREREVLQEKEQMKQEFEKEKKQIQEQHNKEIADIIMGRKTAQEVQNNDEEENDKSFFDKMVDETRKKLGITKEEKK